MSDLISRQKVLNTLDFADNALTDEDRTVENYKELLMKCIEVLPSAENNGDLISRKSLLNKINAYVVGSQDKEFICKLIKEMPSAENKCEWNPLGSNEDGMIIGSLPEEGEEVLVTVYGQVEIDSFGCDVEYDESVDESRYEWFCENNDIEDVRAWMPKPAPYKGKVDNNEKV